MATVGVLVVGQRGGDRLAMALAIYVVCVLVLNAVVHGSVSGPAPRYQAKVGWLVVLVAVSCVQRFGARSLSRLFGARPSAPSS